MRSMGQAVRGAGMKSHYRVVVIGGGVVGASVLYHLTKYGWSDVALVERSVLTAGSSWHAAGGFHALNANPNMAILQAYTIDLLKEVEAESGQSIGMHMTGGIHVASAPERWEWLQSSYRRFQAIGIDDVRLVTAEEIKARCPIINVEGVLGGMWADREGYVDTTGTVWAYAGAAKKRGATVIEHNRVLELKQRPDSSWDLITEAGTINAEHVVNAGGLWAKQVGRMVGLDLPLSPLEHHYLLTETIPEIAAAKTELPMVVDLEGFTYMRQDQKGMLVGIYETHPQHWSMDGAPWDYGVELLQENIDRIADELELVHRRYPVLQTAGVRKWVNGAFTFSPDGNPLIGPIAGKRGYWLACGVMAGFLQGGGVGKSLAEWMIHGEASTDVMGLDIARYGAHASNREYIKETTGEFYARRFVMTYPNEQLPAGRPLKMTPSYDAMTAAGCHWGNSWGLEVPLFFAPAGFKEKPTLKRSNAFESWLDWMTVSRLPKPGRARLAPMLSETGLLKGDLTVINWGDGTFWIEGSYYLRQWHMRWFASHARQGVEVRDISDDVIGFSLSGPKSRELLARVTHQDVSNAALPFMGAATLDVGLIRAKVARLSVTGELGYEINCRALEHAGLRRLLLEAGRDLGVKEYGYNALLSLRLEKSFGIWSAEFTQAYTPRMTGMDRWIAWDKGEFVGKKAALVESKGAPPERQLVNLEIDAADADATGYEPVWRSGTMAGFVTSGGYGHTIGKSLAMALVAPEAAEVGSELAVHIVGVERKARVIAPSPYDPAGKAMRA
jgi:dimethylglycine dehydrogenase